MLALGGVGGVGWGGGGDSWWDLEIGDLQCQRQGFYRIIKRRLKDEQDDSAN